MDAIELLKDKIDPEKLLEHYDFTGIRHHGNMIRSCCKLHGGDNPTSFVMNEEGVWYCHTGDCGAGDVYTLVQIMEGLTFRESVEWVAQFFHVDIANLSIKERADTYVKELKSWMKALTSRRKKLVSPYSISVPVREVTKFRDFEPETLRHFELGFVDEISLEKRDGGSYTLRNRLVFPIYQNGVMVGASFRKTKSQDFPKWSHQPVNLETSDILYNYDSVKHEPSIVVVEGMPDVWAYYEIGVPAVATFGAHMTDEQYKLLMRTGADLVFSYDGDEAGRFATRKCTTGYKDKKGTFIQGIFKNKANCSVVLFDEGEDPASIPREQLKLNYERRKKV